MRSVVVFSFLLLFSLKGYTQTFCPTLETVKFASETCIPTTNQLCHSGQPGNCEVRGTLSTCKYINGTGSHYVDESSRPGFECTDWAQECDGEPGEGGQNCHPGKCVKWKPPKCKLLCKPCYQNDIAKQYPIRGCVKFCGEKSCGDEPRCDPDPCKPGDPCNQNNPPCPGPVKIIVEGDEYVYPKVPWQKCGTNQKCPASYDMDSELRACIAERGLDACLNCRYGGCGGHVENGKYIPPTSTLPPDCSKPIEPGKSSQNGSCPWIDYEKRQSDKPGENSCRDVTVGNRFPQDCCICKGGVEGVSCKNCGAVTKERCNE